MFVLRYFNSSLVRGLACAVYMAAMFLLSSLQFAPAPARFFRGEDKVFHAVEYAGLAVLLWLFVSSVAHHLSRRSRVGISFLVGCAYACSDEVHQIFVPTRQADVWDVVADALGLALALVLLWLLSRHTSRQTHN